MLLMMEDVILMEVIVVFGTKILNSVSSALAMLISQKVDTCKMMKEMNDHSSFHLKGCWLANDYVIGDSICHGSANTEICNYDDGDCCLPEIYKECSGEECICHEDGLVRPEKVCEYEYIIQTYLYQILFV